MNIPSKILENAVYEISRLPGIGKSTALRLALHLIKSDSSEINDLINSVKALHENLKSCKNCYNLSDSEVCDICNSSLRDDSLICVVEDIRDIMAIENTSQFNGLYHVLNGKISPIEGVGPSQLTIQELIDRINKNKIREVIFALSATMEGDTTSFYIYKKISNDSIKFSSIARGVSVGDNLEYTDEITLGRSILKRVPYEQSTKE
jgi:recombination protein RecR